MQEFEVRRATLFASLDSAANEIGHELKKNNVSNVRAINDHDNNVSEHESVIEEVQHRNRLGCIRGQGSMFLRPEAPINKCLGSRRLPDYQRNPHKWKKYSLVDADDSDLANRVGALMFLQKIANAKSMKNSQIEDMADEEDKVIEMANLNEKIEFKQRKSVNRDLVLRNNTDIDDAQQSSSQLKNGKVVMPEYVIGKHSKNKTKNKLKSHDSEIKRAAGNLTLSHLQEEEEEE